MRDERAVAGQYDEWLRSPGFSSVRGLAALFAVASLMPGLNHAVNAPALRLDERLGLDPSHRLAEIGCGAGALLRHLNGRVRFHTPPVGIEPSGVALRLARRLTPAGDIEYRHGYATRLSLPDESVDVILCGHVTRFLSDAAVHAMYVEAHRVLRPAGRLVVWDYAPAAGAPGRVTRWLLTRGAGPCTLRPYAGYAHLATRSGFERIELFELGPFFLPPIPRIAFQLTRRTAAGPV